MSSSNFFEHFLRLQQEQMLSLENRAIVSFELIVISQFTVANKTSLSCFDDHPLNLLACLFLRSKNKKVAKGQKNILEEKFEKTMKRNLSLRL